jgi:hypothetical protein
MIVNERPQRGFKTVQPTLHFTDGLCEVAEAPPFGTGWGMQRRREAKASGEGTEVVRRCEGSGQGNAVEIEVEVDKEEAKPLDETGALQVGCNANFVHRALKVLNAPVEVARSIRHTSLGQQQGCCVENSEEFFAWSWQMVSRQRGERHGIFEPFSKAFRLRREPPRTHSIKALSSRSNPTASVPYEEIDLHAVLGHNGGRMPLHHKPHTAT